MDVYISYNQNGVYRLTLDDNWNLTCTKYMFHPGQYCLGLDYYKDHFYCVGSSKKSLFKLDRDWKVVTHTTLRDCDAHGVDCFDDKVVVTNPSGMHMEIYTLDLELIKKSFTYVCYLVPNFFRDC